MHNIHVDSLFRDLTFEFSSAEIRNAVEKKRAKIEAKIVEREARIEKIRSEYKIDDTILIELLRQARDAERHNLGKMSYTISNRTGVAAPNSVDAEADASAQKAEVTIGAGTVSFLMAESDLIASEQSQLKRLGIIARNIRDVPDRTVTTLPASGNRPMRGHELSFSEMEFLDL